MNNEANSNPQSDPLESSWMDPTSSEVSDGAPRTPVKHGAKTWVLSAVGGVAIVAASIFGINAASSASTTASSSAAGSTAAAAGAAGGPGAMGGGGTFGTITSVDGSTIVLTDQSGTATTVATTDSTVVTTSTDAAAADLEVGDNVRVDGSGTATAITARRVTDSGDVVATDGPGGGGAGGGGTPPAGAPTGSAPTGSAPSGTAGQSGDRVNTSGVIASIDGTTMVVTTSDGSSVTVTLSDSTTISKSSVVTVADLATGDTIMVRGATADGTLTATSISEGAGGMGPMGGGTPPSGASTQPSTTS